MRYRKCAVNARRRAPILSQLSTLDVKPNQQARCSDFKQRRVLTHLTLEKSATLPQMVNGVVGDALGERCDGVHTGGNPIVDRSYLDRTVTAQTLLD